MIINPLNVEAFYFKELPKEVQLIIINNKISFIINNLKHSKYIKYKQTIDSFKDSKDWLNYRELIKKYHSNDLIKDILKENRMYDINGNMFNIIYKDGVHLLFLTKTTSIPVQVVSEYKYSVSYNKDGINNTLPIIEVENMQEIKNKIAKKFAVSKSKNLDSDKHINNL